MRQALGRRSRLVPATALLAVAGAILALALHGSSADASRHRGPNPTWLILRLSDLPLGYLKFDLQEEQGERIYCSQLTHSDDTPPKMGRFIDHFHPRGCLGAYYRLFSLPGEEPGPKLAAAGVLPLQSAKAAGAGWAIVPVMLGRLFGRVPKEVPAPERVGSATRLFHSNDFPRFYRLGHRASILVWRSGNTLAATMAVGPSFEADDRAAAELALHQQAHVEKPTRYTLAERFDGEVPLEDPAVDIPVYWLGRNFKPGNGLADNRLFDSYFSGKASGETQEKFGSEGPGAPLAIRYENIRLDTWTPATWQVFADSRTGHAITGWKCTQRRTVTLPEGTATIFGGYKKNFKRCPKGEPEAFTAWVDIGGVKVVVNSPPAPDFIETVNPYGSFAGMEAIVSALTVRPKPVYASSTG
jgi:hypothetical protein